MNPVFITYEEGGTIHSATKNEIAAMPLILKDKSTRYGIFAIITPYFRFDVKLAELGKTDIMFSPPDQYPMLLEKLESGEIK